MAAISGDYPPASRDWDAGAATARNDPVRIVQPGDDFDRHLAKLVDAVTIVSPTTKAALVVFHPADAPEQHVLYSNAAAADLLPVLKALVARLERGELRMPVAGGARWVEEQGEG